MERYQRILKKYGMKSRGEKQEELDDKLLFYVRLIGRLGEKEKEELEWQTKSHLRNCFVAWETPIQISDAECFKKRAQLEADEEVFADIWIPRLRLAYIRNSEGINRFFYYDGDLSIKEIQGTKHPKIQQLFDRALEVAPEEQKIKALFDEKKKMELISKGMHNILVSFINKLTEMEFAETMTKELIEENLKIIEEKKTEVI